MTDAVTHFHLFSGIGGAARGGHHVQAIGGLEGRMVCLGGVDVDAGACAVFERYVGAPCANLDLFSRDQYLRFHGAPPPSTWAEATADDLRRAAQQQAPDIVVTSPPCKGFSGLLSNARSKEPKYQALNELTLRGVDLALEAWGDEPPAFWLLENVPRLVSRGAELLAQIVARLEAAGYETSYTIPDLGEIGNLGQSRKRLHLVARHRQRCPVWVFEPPRRSLRSIGDVLGPLPMPGAAMGPLHELPRLSWRTWVRLALIPAGGDWRALRDLAIDNEGNLRDFALAADASWHGGALGVVPWSRHSGTVTSEGRVQNGAFAVADPRFPETWGEYGQYGVQPWAQSSATVTANGGVGGGPAAIADPRLDLGGGAHGNAYAMKSWDESGPTVTGARSVGSGLVAIADPRWNLAEGTHTNICAVRPWGDSSATVTGANRPGCGVISIADPRPTAVHFNQAFRVISWDQPSVVVSGGSAPSSGGLAIADPRAPRPEDRGAWIIRALDGSWHRPTTVLERAALQGLLDESSAEEVAAAFEGASASRASEWIGNAIPPPAMAESLRAAAVAILLSRRGQAWALGATPRWVAPLARAVLTGADAR